MSEGLPNPVLLKQLILYAIVGGFAFMIDFALLAYLTEKAGFHYLVSATISFIFGLSVNYSLCITWVFEHRSVQNRLHEFALFLLIGLFGLSANNASMYLLTEIMGIHYLHSKIWAVGLIFIMNFFLRKFILFNEHKIATLNTESKSNGS